MQDSESKPCALLVEGPDDKHVVIQLSERCGLAHNFWVIPKGGKNTLLDSIEVEAIAPGRKALGIVLDADEDPNARWQAVTDRLRRLVQEDLFDLADLPNQPSSKGIIIEGRIRIGIWVMPDNSSNGELEDFVGEMIPSGDLVWPLSETYIHGIPEAERKFAPGKIQRAKVHAWLATRKKPRPMGTAIESRDLDTDVTTATLFINWLRELFSDCPQIP